MPKKKLPQTIEECGAVKDYAQNCLQAPAG